MKQSRRDRQSGQAMVETAITMPLFVFIILGSLQLALAHQARLLTKYAAFKAARAGALHHADMKHMERAAASVLMPAISYSSGGKDYFLKSKSATEYAVKAPFLMANKAWGPGLPIVEVTICSPTTAPNTSSISTSATKPSSGKASGQVVGFDMPDTQYFADYEPFLQTQLDIQVEFNYRMPIPFANMMIYHIFNGTESKGLQTVTRTYSTNNTMATFGVTKQKGTTSGKAGRLAAYAAGSYFIPIRTWWGMRMQSDLYPNGISKLPATNECVIPDGR